MNRKSELGKKGLTNENGWFIFIVFWYLRWQTHSNAADNKWAIWLWMMVERGEGHFDCGQSQKPTKWKKSSKKYSVYFTAITKGKHLAIHNNKLAFDAFVNKTTGVYSVDDTLPLPFDCGLIVCFMCVCVCVFHICLSTKWKSPVVFSLLFDYLM